MVQMTFNVRRYRKQQTIQGEDFHGFQIFVNCEGISIKVLVAVFLLKILVKYIVTDLIVTIYVAIQYMEHGITDTTTVHRNLDSFLVNLFDP